jgi:hypothetical protein
LRRKKKWSLSIIEAGYCYAIKEMMREFITVVYFVAIHRARQYYVERSIGFFFAVRSQYLLCRQLGTSCSNGGGGERARVYFPHIVKLDNDISDGFQVFKIKAFNFLIVILTK